MKTKPSINLWVYHRVDGKTTISVYVNAKRRNLATFRSCSTDQDFHNFCGHAQNESNRLQRKISFQGDTLTVPQLDIIETQYNFLA